MIMGGDLRDSVLNATLPNRCEGEKKTPASTPSRRRCAAGPSRPRNAIIAPVPAEVPPSGFALAVQRFARLGSRFVAGFDRENRRPFPRNPLRGDNARGLSHARPVRPEGLALCLGTMMFGGPTPDDEAGRIVAEAREQGINFIDTANAYTGGAPRRVVGPGHRPDRDAWVLATKVANAMGTGPNDRGLSRAHIVQACEASLKRLNTDRIDLYYLHKEDHDDAALRDRAGDGRPDPGRQGAVFRGLQPPPWRWPRSAASATSTASTGRRRASPITTPSTGCRRSSTCRPAPITGWASCPIRPWPAAC